MMQAAPAAPRAPAIVALIRPVVPKPDSSPCEPSTPTGSNTPIRKYATPTQSSAFRGLPNCVCPRYSNAPYAPQDNTAPATKITQPIRFFLTVAVVLTVAVMSVPNRVSVAAGSGACQLVHRGI